MTVKTILLEDSSSEWDQRQIHLVNKAAMSKARELQTKVDGSRCPSHPEHMSVLIVQAMPSGMIMIDRSGTCCDEFMKPLI
jgi:hypothetical protein